MHLKSRSASSFCVCQEQARTDKNGADAVYQREPAILEPALNTEHSCAILCRAKSSSIGPTHLGGRRALRSILSGAGGRPFPAFWFYGSQSCGCRTLPPQQQNEVAGDPGLRGFRRVRQHPHSGIPNKNQKRRITRLQRGAIAKYPQVVLLSPPLLNHTHRCDCV